MKKLFFTVLKILVFFIGWAVLSGVIDIPSDNPAIWRFFAELIPFAVLLLFTVIFWLIDKKTVKIPICDNIGKGTLTGAIIGFVWIGAAAAILFLSKQILVTGKKQIPLLWLWIISAFINVVMQELLIRGYIYQLLKEKYNLLTAIIFTTILFTALHGGAFEAGIIPVLNVISMCLFTSALYESEKTLLAPIMAHAIWNILGAIIIGGVNLADDYPHMLTLSASQNKLLSGGDYKIEASIVVTFLNIALMMMFYTRYRKQK
ncbi:MAG: CPBP family intramembrane metalloprotease, partial [Clostridia bacterium]|nr:CPBP family intramembrane metalloprotease [Clostridia bacterium]